MSFESSDSCVVGNRHSLALEGEAGVRDGLARVPTDMHGKAIDSRIRARGITPERDEQSKHGAGGGEARERGLHGALRIAQRAVVALLDGCDKVCLSPDNQ